MKKEERKSREKIKKVDIAEPILDFSVFNLKDNDPCFGKLWDLRADECRSCGDSEFCGIMFSQGLHNTRSELSSQNHYLDEEHAKYMDTHDKVDKTFLNKKIKAYAKEKSEKGYDIEKVVRLCKIKFKKHNLTDKELKTIIKN